MPKTSSLLYLESEVLHRERTKNDPAMILTASHLLRELRWVPPAVIIIGSMTPFLNQWVIIRVLTLPLPSRVYQRLEERLYSNYQAVVGFFYEIWSGVEVYRLPYSKSSL